MIRTKITLLLISFSLIGCNGGQEPTKLNKNAEQSITFGNDIISKFGFDLPGRIKIKEIEYSNSTLSISIEFDDVIDNSCVPMYSHYIAFLAHTHLSKEYDIRNFVLNFDFIKDNSKYEYSVSLENVIEFMNLVMINKRVLTPFNYCLFNLSNSDIHYLDLYLKELVPDYCPKCIYENNFFQLLIDYYNSCPDSIYSEPLGKIMTTLYEITSESPSKVDSKHMKQLIEYCDSSIENEIVK